MWECRRDSLLRPLRGSGSALLLVLSRSLAAPGANCDTSEAGRRLGAAELGGAASPLPGAGFCRLLPEGSFAGHVPLALSQRAAPDPLCGSHAAASSSNVALCNALAHPYGHVFGRQNDTDTLCRFAKGRGPGAGRTADRETSETGSTNPPLLPVSGCKSLSRRTSLRDGTGWNPFISTSVLRDAGRGRGCAALGQRGTRDKPDLVDTR